MRFPTRSGLITAVGICLLMLTAAPFAHSFSITGNLYRITQLAHTNSLVELTPLSGTVIDGANIYTPFKATFTVSNGTFSQSLVVGRYSFAVDGRTLFTFAGPNDSSTNSVTSLITNAVNFASTNAFAFIMRTNGTGLSNTLTAPVLRQLSFTTNVPGYSWVAVGTNGGGSWSNVTGGSSGLTTNSSQFLGVPLAIKSGASLTNLTNSGNFFFVGTTNDAVSYFGAVSIAINADGSVSFNGGDGEAFAILSESSTRMFELYVQALHVTDSGDAASFQVGDGGFVSQVDSQLRGKTQFGTNVGGHFNAFVITNDYSTNIHIGPYANPASGLSIGHLGQVGVSNLTLRTATASRVAMFNSSKDLTNDIPETGGGALVRSNAPTLNTPTIIGTLSADSFAQTDDLGSFSVDATLATFAGEIQFVPSGSGSELHITAAGRPVRTNLQHISIQSGAGNANTLTNPTVITNLSWGASASGGIIASNHTNGLTIKGAASSGAGTTFKTNGSVNIETTNASALSISGSNALFGMPLNSAWFGGNGGNTNITGVQNTAFGHWSMRDDSVGFNNSSFGALSLQANTNGQWNSAFGVRAMRDNLSGNDSSAFGVQALYHQTSGVRNSGFGVNTLLENLIGEDNTAVGWSAGQNVNAGYYNTAVGSSALFGNTSGSFNVGVGLNAQYAKNTGDGNTAVGAYSIRENTTGGNNTAIGYRAGYGTAANAFSANIFIGFQAGDNVSTGNSNIVIGYNIDLPSAASAQTLNIGNLIFGTGLNGSGTTTSSGFVGFGTPNPLQSTTISNTSASAIDSFGVYASNNPTPSILVKSNGTTQLGGHQIFATDNTWDIGASGATRPRTGYFGTSVSAPTLTASSAVSTPEVNISSQVRSLSPANGVLTLYNVAGIDFNRVQFGGTTAAFPALGRTNGDLIMFGADGAFAGGATNRLLVHGGLIVGKPGTSATLTNTLYASAALDFPSTAAGGVSDLPITLAAASDGDIVSLGVPSAQLTGLTGDYFAWASNGAVYVRFANNNLVSAQDPGSGTFKVRVDKFQ